MSFDALMGGIHLDRRRALALGGRVAATLAALGSASALLSGCSTGPDPEKDYRPLVMTLLGVVIPGSAQAANADFVARAVKGGMRGVPSDVLGQLETVLDEHAGGGFAKASVASQIAAIRKLDVETFAAGATGPAPWYSVKALLLMAYYTSEEGMSKNLRYELVPGRYDVDVVIDKTWRPLSNDWQAVAISNGITRK